MIGDKLWIKDPKTGEKSVTVTILVATFGVAMLKVIASGMQFGGVTLDKFTGTDFSLMVGAAGAIYGYRKNTDAKKGVKK